MEAAAQPAGAPEAPRQDAAGESPADAHAASGNDVFAERPELFVGAAFAGGIVLAQILKRVRR
jgi:hypothetical protein